MQGLPASAQSDSSGSTPPFTSVSLDEVAGKALFERVWVSPPASTTASDGLGPYYNAASCDTCHPKGGQGKLSADSLKIPESMVLHFLSPEARKRFGHQWQPYAVRGLSPEPLSVTMTYESLEFLYNDGEKVLLSRPRFTVSANEKAPLPSSTVISARLAPDLHGTPQLADLPLPDSQQGHLGWQATQKNLEEQIAVALSRDLGLGNPGFPSAAGDCTPEQQACLALAATTLSGDSLETGIEVLQLLEIYLRGLPVPETPDISPEEPGWVLFRQLTCDTCHVRSLVLEGRNVIAYTDLALHDMGSGLADRTPGDEPVPARWRTAPLWALSERLDSGSAGFLHDGRAANPEEAVLWHGGEAEAAKNAFASLSREQRKVFLDFLSGL